MRRRRAPEVLQCSRPADDLVTSSARRLRVRRAATRPTATDPGRGLRRPIARVDDVLRRRIVGLRRDALPSAAVSDAGAIVAADDGRSRRLRWRHAAGTLPPAPAPRRRRMMRRLQRRQVRTAGVCRSEDARRAMDWCLGSDSNRHPFRDQILSLARLPITPPRQGSRQELAQGADYHMTKARFVVRCDNGGVLSSSRLPEIPPPCRRTRPSKTPSATRRWCACSASSARRSRRAAT